MAAGIYNFTIEQGTTHTFRVDYKDSNNEPVDLTGFTARMQIRNAPKGSTLHASLTNATSSCGTGLYLTPEINGIPYPASSGSIEVVISAVSSSAFNFDQASYDLEVVHTDPITFCETVTRVLQGKIKLSKEVTY
jgi:hypothetical protein